MGPCVDSSDEALLGSSTLSARETMYVALTIMMTRSTSMTSTIGVTLMPTMPPPRRDFGPTAAPMAYSSAPMAAAVSDGPSVDSSLSSSAAAALDALSPAGTGASPKLPTTPSSAHRRLLMEDTLSSMSVIFR